MRRKLCSLCLVFAIGFVALATPLATVAAETIQRTVRGVVTATNTAVDPQTIVVKVVPPNKEELIVGARVPTDTKITRGTRATKLADLKGVGFTEVTTKTKLALQALNVADGSTIRMTLNGSGADDVFWFDPEDAQALVNDLLTDSFGKLVQDTTVENKQLRLKSP